MTGVILVVYIFILFVPMKLRRLNFIVKSQGQNIKLYDIDVDLEV